MSVYLCIYVFVYSWICVFLYLGLCVSLLIRRKLWQEESCSSKDLWHVDVEQGPDDEHGECQRPTTSVTECHHQYLTYHHHQYLTYHHHQYLAYHHHQYLTYHHHQYLTSHHHQYLSSHHHQYLTPHHHQYLASHHHQYLTSHHHQYLASYHHQYLTSHHHQYLPSHHHHILHLNINISYISTSLSHQISLWYFFLHIVFSPLSSMLWPLKPLGIWKMLWVTSHGMKASQEVVTNAPPLDIKWSWCAPCGVGELSAGGWAITNQYGMVWYGVAWYSMVWYGMACYGLAINNHLHQLNQLSFLLSLALPCLVQNIYHWRRE